MVVSKKPEFLVIGGCLRGLAGYLTSFTNSVEEGITTFSIHTNIILSICSYMFLIYSSSSCLFVSSWFNLPDDPKGESF